LRFSSSRERPPAALYPAHERLGDASTRLATLYEAEREEDGGDED